MIAIIIIKILQAGKNTNTTNSDSFAACFPGVDCYTTLYYTILYYTILYYTILYYTILYYTILYYTILYYTTLHYTTLHYTTLISPPLIRDPPNKKPWGGNVTINLDGGTITPLIRNDFWFDLPPS